MDVLTPSDRALFADALANVAQAQATLVFVQRHLAVVYRIREGDTVNPSSGEIVRGEPKQQT